MASTVRWRATAYSQGRGRPAITVQAALGVNLEKRILQRILDQRLAAQVPRQVATQLTRVTPIELGKILGPAQVSIATEQRIVTESGEIGLIGRPRRRGRQTAFLALAAR